MFDLLFKRSATRCRHQVGPLAQERLAYLRHLADNGMSHASLLEVAPYLLAVARYLRLADRGDEIISVNEIDGEAVRWAKRRSTPNRRPGRRSRATFRCHAIDWLHFLGRLEFPHAPAHPHAELMAAFADYMCRDRGLSAGLIRMRVWSVRRFLDFFGIATDSVQTLTVTRIDETFQKMANRYGWARRTVQTQASHLRVFFAYAERHGWPQGLAQAIESPRVFSQTSLPRGPSWDDVQRLIATTEGDESSDIRDRGILLLLAVYGLRADEVRRLRLDSFDWERERLAVACPKSLQTRTFPLCRSVGDAVLRYLKEVRPRSAYREVFLSLRFPVQPLGNVWRVVSKRLRALGVSLPHHGPHSLRHACAFHLLTEGLSLKEIGDHLGHRHPDSTRIYANVDLTGLRQVADFDLGELP